jgi:putative membrane protein
MLHTLWLLLSTIAYRPYVFVFLFCYLILAITHLGWRRAAFYTVLAYLVAFACEWSSAVGDYGFPFGPYRYINTTSEKELWVAGVPFMDSLSFSFLSYLSWETAILLCGKLRASWRDVQTLNREEIHASWTVTLVTAFLMTWLDLVIDPLTLLGDRWFLGKIYYYPQGGVYFGIPLSNFAGWFVLAIVIIRVYVWFERKLFNLTEQAGIRSYPFKALGAVMLYFGVLGFNLFMTFWIGEKLLGLVDAFLILPIIVMLGLALQRGAQASSLK